MVMKSLFHAHSKGSFFRVSLIFFTVAILISITLHSVRAQEGLEPQLVTATYYNGDCFPNGVENRIEIYNVGSQGGEAYSQAVYTYAITSIGNLPEGGIACFVDGYSQLLGTFTGGPNGTITFPEGNDQDITTCQVLDGKTIECKFVMNLLDLGIQEFTDTFTIQNPEAFQPSSKPTEGPAATQSTGCTPNVRGLDPAKPGDVISPGADYFDANGKATGIIQERWFFNGKESTSIVWDGKPVTVELQWTCLDHSGFSRTFSIAAYQEPPAAVVTGQERKEPQGITPWDIAAVAGVVLGGAAAVGVGIGLIWKDPPAGLPAAPPSPPAPQPQAAPVSYGSASIPAEPSPPAPPISYAPPVPPQPPLPAPPVQPEPPVSAPPEPSAPTPPAQPAGLTPAQQAELVNIRGEMENEVENIKSKWRANRDAVEKLKDILQKNLLKFTFKKGFDVSEWIMDSPVEVINKIALDPIMEKVFEKHDTSQDGSIIVKINNRIQQLQNEMQDLVNQEKYLQEEISKINQKLH